jgi:hypothetical protein
VCVQGVTGTCRALHDGGLEINLINRELLTQLPEVPTMGRIGIKGIVGPAVQTDVALLEIKLASTAAGCVNKAPALSEVFAICNNLNEDIILTLDTVKRLGALSECEALVLVNQVAGSSDGRNSGATSECSVVTDSVESERDPINNEGKEIVDISSHGDSDSNVVANTDEIRHDETDLTSADTLTLIREQRDDPSLAKYFDLAKNENKQFFLRNDILYRCSKVQGNKVEQLCLPERRVQTVLELAHDLPVPGHQAVRHTTDKIALSFFFPRQLLRVKQFCDSCSVCQLRARERRTDLVPIRPISRHEDNFGHLQADLIGPFGRWQVQVCVGVNRRSVAICECFRVDSSYSK